MDKNIDQRVENILNELTQNEYQDIFANCKNINDKLQLLTSESMLALIFISTLEDEFSIEFEDDELDINFFSDIDNVEKIIKKHLIDS